MGSERPLGGLSGGPGAAPPGFALLALLAALPFVGCTPREVLTRRVCTTRPAGPFAVEEIRFHQVVIEGEMRLFGRTPPRPAEVILLVGRDGQVMYLDSAFGMAIRGQEDPVLLDMTGPPRQETLWWPDANGWFIPGQIGRSKSYPKQIAPWPARPAASPQPSAER